MLTFAKYLHLLSSAIWIGSIFFFSFIGAPAIFKTFDKKTAGDVVGAIFPKYFLLGEICGLVSLVALIFIGVKLSFPTGVKIGLVLLLVMLTGAVYSGRVNGPAAREIKAQIRTETDETKLEKLKKSFGKLHGISMVVNITILLSGLLLFHFLVGYYEIKS